MVADREPEVQTDSEALSAEDEMKVWVTAEDSSGESCPSGPETLSKVSREVA